MEKKCNCCAKVHTKVPVNARPQMDFEEVNVIGYMWECDCKSTMFFMVKPLVKIQSRIIKAVAS